MFPLDVVNSGGRSIRDLQLRVEYRDRGGERRDMELLSDYLGQSSEQVVYTYFRDDRRGLSIRAEAISYRVD